MKKLRLGAALLLLGFSGQPSEAAIALEFAGCMAWCQAQGETCLDEGSSDLYCSGLVAGCTYGCWRR